jgi:NADH-quinone oxidoreductase subunit L
MVNLAHLIPVFPVAAFVINVLVGRRIKRFSAIVSISASLMAWCLSLYTLVAFLRGQESYTLLKWLSVGGMSLNIGVIVDPLTCMMLVVVTTIGTLIQIYSVGYMKGDMRFSRFFAYLSLFMSSMLGLLLADNLIALYIFWEGVGLCSYLLISFWFEKPAAARAGMKAFITTRIGDTGLLIGIFILAVSAHTVYFRDIAQLTDPGALFTAAALLIFCGAVGKSAQFPLHVWLPDAMEGPTPVSALIHAATMVAAGVYLVARCFTFFAAHGQALLCVAYVGGLTAIFAASIAVVNNDIKRVLAYSTISQLGFMMMGLGVGGYSAGTFHLMTHAFFKALLFLCAGSVIHSVHTQDIQAMGGIFKKMKVTGATFVIASLAIAGIPPFAGFWSKDEILSEVLHSGHPFLFVVASVTSVLTAFYMFRLIFLSLFGKPRSEIHPHESPAVMTVPLAILAVFAALIGLIGSPFVHHAFQTFISHGQAHEAEGRGPDYMVMGLSTLLALLGIGTAYLLYMLNKEILPQRIRRHFTPLYNLVSNKYYIDEIYSLLFIKPIIRLSRLASKFDLGVIDGAVNGAAWITVILSKISAWIDHYIVDGAVNMVAMIFRLFSLALRRIQTGYIQTYLLIAFFGLAIIILIKLIGG